MKILCIIDSLGSGGAQRQLVNLGTGLVKLGYEIEFFIYHSSNLFFLNELEKNNIKVNIVKQTKKGFSLNVQLKLISLLKENFDGIISFLHSPSIYAAIGKIFNPKLQLIIGERSSSLSSVSLSKKILFNFAKLISNKVVCNSFSESQRLKKQFFLSNKVNTIWNGYQIKKIDSVSFKNKKSKKQLLVVGRISYPKNGINLMKALMLFYKNNGWIPTIKWAGRRDFDNQSSKTFNEMNDFLSQNPKLKNSWIWLGEVKNLNILYNESDALILPSLWEGLPNVICEAMLLGCNVIASNVCDNYKLLGNGNHGILFEPKSINSICQSIEKFYLLSEEEKIKMAKTARKFAMSNLDLKKMVRSYEELLN
tara:strand:+ start:440 stop:1537 length:1098 start_codon:yes stop_codon:yes gene_type:complete